MNKVSHRKGYAIAQSGLLATLHSELEVTSAGPLALVASPNPHNKGGKPC